MRTIQITEEYITLGQVLKLAGFANCGVDAKHMILEGKVLVNNGVEIRRGKKIRDGDIVEIEGGEKIVISEKNKDR
ncbi:MAG: RNA-binding protein [Flavobacterium sp.]|nr:RNA-binding protein [Flavobacterium sp.]